MTLSKKLKIGAGIPVIMFLVLAIVFYLQFRWMGRCFTQLTEVEVPKNEAASRMEINLIGAGFELMGYLQDHDPVRIQRIQAYKNNFKEHQSIYCRLATATKTELSADLIDRNIAFLGKIIEELINLEDYQTQRLALLSENFDKIDGILMEGFKAHGESKEQADYKKLGTVMEMRSRAGEIRVNLDSYLTNYQEQYEKGIFEAQKELGMLADVYKDFEKHVNWFERFNAAYVENMNIIKDIMTLSRNKRDRLEKFIKEREKLRMILGDNLRETQANYVDSRLSSYRAVRTSAIVTLLLVLIGLVVTIIFQAYVAYSVILPITEIGNAAVKISRGKYDTKIDIRSDDELGQIANSISKMAEELKGTPVSSDLTGREAAEPEKAAVSS
jgi:HAMP domain-containing protein